MQLVPGLHLAFMDHSGCDSSVKDLPFRTQVAYFLCQSLDRHISSLFIRWFVCHSKACIQPLRTTQPVILCLPSSAGRRPSTYNKNARSFVLACNSLYPLPVHHIVFGLIRLFTHIRFKFIRWLADLETFQLKLPGLRLASMDHPAYWRIFSDGLQIAISAPWSSNGLWVLNFSIKTPRSASRLYESSTDSSLNPLSLLFIGYRWQTSGGSGCLQPIFTGLLLPLRIQLLP